jgi:adenosyl cobinamide kinase/adenosyl cobinamide phosphate guanylyltransferase
VILIVGGSYQGKLDYALRRFGYGEGDVYGCAESEPDLSPGDKPVIYKIEKWVLAAMRSGADPAARLGVLMPALAEKVVVCTDVSCGVVPVESELRQWRECVGRAAAILARASDEVIRLFCGIPTRIK